MIAILLKDRGNPVHVYLQYMIKVMNLSRTEAAQKLGKYVFETGLRNTPKAPLNNAMEDWKRTQKAPQWAVLGCIGLLEALGKIPQTEQEWAFWAWSRMENPNKINERIPDGWPENEAKKWLEDASNYHYWYGLRSLLRKLAEKTSDPLLAARIMYTLLGCGNYAFSLEDLFFSIDESKLSQEQIASSLKNDVRLNKFQMDHVRHNDEQAKKSYESIIKIVKELEALSYLSMSNELGISVNIGVIKTKLEALH